MCRIVPVYGRRGGATSGSKNSEVAVSHQTVRPCAPGFVKSWGYVALAPAATAYVAVVVCGVGGGGDGGGGGRVSDGDSSGGGGGGGAP